MMELGRRSDILSAQEVPSLTPTLGSSVGVVPPLPVSVHGQVGSRFEQGSVPGVCTGCLGDIGKVNKNGNIY